MIERGVSKTIDVATRSQMLLEQQSVLNARVQIPQIRERLTGLFNEHFRQVLGDDSSNAALELGGTIAVLNCKVPTDEKYIQVSIKSDVLPEHYGYVDDAWFTIDVEDYGDTLTLGKDQARIKSKEEESKGASNMQTREARLEDIKLYQGIIDQITQSKTVFTSSSHMVI